MHDESYHADTGRIEALSDGVFAIAITLLVLEIAVPHVDAGQSLASELRHLWPSYAAYSVSFISIGIMWANHPNMFKDIARFDHSVIVLNLLLLLTASFVPFPTALVAEYIREKHHETEAVLVYAATFAANAVAFNALRLYVWRSGDLIDGHVSQRRLRSRTLRYAAGLVIYSLSIPLTFISFWFPLAIGAGLALFFLLPLADDPA